MHFIIIYSVYLPFYIGNQLVLFLFVYGADVIAIARDSMVCMFCSTHISEMLDVFFCAALFFIYFNCGCNFFLHQRRLFPILYANKQCDVISIMHIMPYSNFECVWVYVCKCEWDFIYAILIAAASTIVKSESRAAYTRKKQRIHHFVCLSLFSSFNCKFNV